MSLSNLKVVSLLNSYYIPVYASNEDYRGNGSAPPEERAELNRIHREGYAAKLSVGTVHAYILNPVGHLVDSMHTAQVAKPELLIAMLEKNGAGIPAGAPVIKPTPQPPPKPEPDSLLLHLTSRYLEWRGNELILTGPGENDGGWGGNPSEDWISLTRAEWSALLPPGKPRIGQAWDVDKKVAEKLLIHFYPPTENWDLSTNRIDRRSLRAEVTSPTTIRLSGDLLMKHPFYHKDDDRFVEAGFLGFIEFDTGARPIKSFQMTTEDAAYRSGAGGNLPFGVAVRSVR